jgi:branched-chain amino acid aminotransferase
MIITNRGIAGDEEFGFISTISDGLVYEVIRILDGKALFSEDHYARLKNTLNSTGSEIDMTLDDFKRYMFELAKLNQKEVGNIRFLFDTSNKDGVWSFSFIPHSYPDQKDYRNGVSVELLTGQRENPNAKVIQQNLRDKANQLISDRNIYEVLLVDRDGLITEGSRSNVFFVKDRTFFTAPESIILVGITRQKVLECIKKLGYTIVEKAVLENEIERCDSVFLTGTSPKVLPVNRIGELKFDVKNETVLWLMANYDQMIQEYISRF